MAHAHTPHEADCSSLARRYSGALLLLAIASLLVACGGGASEPALGVSGGGGGGGGGGVGGACVVGGTATALNWNAALGATGYRVYYGTATRTYTQPVGQGVNVVGPTTNYQVPNLSAGTTYYFAVTAYDANGESSYSNEVCKTIS